MSDDKNTTSIEFTLTAPTMSREEERKAKRRAWEKAYHEANKERHAAYKRAWTKVNKQSVRATKKAYYQANKEMILAKDKARFAANPEKYKQALANHKAWYQVNKGRPYGLTASEYAGMVRACNGRCPCCKTPFSEILGKLQQPCVDHDHKLGKVREAVRGIVCGRCNLALAGADDDAKILRACARHLEKFTK
jgi:Recombination endonuclease VII